MKRLPFPDGDVLLDAEDYERLAGKAVYIGTNGYPYISWWRDGQSWPETLHSFVMGGARSGLHIDHDNGNQRDCRKANLIFKTPTGNQVNRKRLNRNNTSGVRGVSPHGTRWKAQLTHQRVNHHLGIFDTQAEAVAARQAAELKHYGELCPSPS